MAAALARLIQQIAAERVRTCGQVRPADTASTASSPAIQPTIMVQSTA